MLLLSILALRCSQMSNKAWTTVKVPTHLCLRIDNVLQWVGYTSRAEYVRDAIREKLRRHELYVENIKENMERAKNEES